MEFHLLLPLLVNVRVLLRHLHTWNRRLRSELHKHCMDRWRSSLRDILVIHRQLDTPLCVLRRFSRPCPSRPLHPSLIATIPRSIAANTTTHTSTTRIKQARRYPSNRRTIKELHRRSPRQIQRNQARWCDLLECYIVFLIVEHRSKQLLHFIHRV